MSLKKYIYKFRWCITLIIIVLSIINATQNIIKNSHIVQKVIIAKKDLEIGTKLSKNDILIKNIPKSILPLQTLNNPKQIFGKQSSTFIPAGNVISNLMLSDIGSLNNIPENRVLVSIKISNGEILKAGDKIDILASSSEYESENKTETNFLAKNAVVISKKTDFQIAVFRNEAEKILSLPANTKILSILIH